MNDSVAIRAICSIAFGVLAIQGALVHAPVAVTTISAAISAASAFAAWAAWGER